MLNLSRPQWAITVATLLALGFVSVIVFLPALEAWYFSDVVCPDLEEELGFRLARRSIPFRGETSDVTMIVAVDPDGIMARSGVRPGDIPFGYVHGVESGFCRDLAEAVAAGSVTVRLVVQKALEQASEKARWVSIKVARR